MSNQNEKNVCIIYQNFSFDIRLLHCGLEDDPNHAVLNKSNDRQSLSYLIDGSGYYYANSRFFELKKGDIYLLPQNTKFSQRANPKNSYKYIYISFSSPNAQFLLEKSGLTANSPVLHINDLEIENKFRKIYDLCFKNTFISIAKANLVFFEILCYLIERNEENNKPIKVNKNAIVEGAQTYIEANYFKDLTVEDICKNSFCNRSYLSKLFKTVCNTTIMNYVYNYRIEKAMEMLVHTNLSIVAIMERVGFNDYSSFFRHFTKATGRSPKVYRKENIKTYTMPRPTKNFTETE